MTKTRAVLDSNVLISGLHHPLGQPRDVLLRATKYGEITMIISPYILSEVKKALLSKLYWAKSRVDDALEELTHFAVSVDPSPTLSVLTHYGDNRVLECAIEGQAAFIVTGDHEMLKLREYRKIGLVSPRQFLETLQGL